MTPPTRSPGLRREAEGGSYLMEAIGFPLIRAYIRARARNVIRGRYPFTRRRLLRLGETPHGASLQWQGRELPLSKHPLSSGSSSAPCLLGPAPHCPCGPSPFFG